MNGRDEHSVLLQRHAHRRAKSIPTVSVILGDGRTASTIWSAHVGAQRGVLASSTTCASDLAAEYLAYAQVRTALHREVSERAARTFGIAAHELSSRLKSQTQRDRKVLVDALGLNDTTVSRELFALSFEGHGTDSARSSPIELLVGAVSLLGHAAPGILIDGHVMPLEKAVEATAALANLVPRLDLALILSHAVWTDRASHAESHAFALLREGIVDLEHRNAASSVPEQHERADGFGPDHPSLGSARSAAELALSHALERASDTRGLFAINRRLPVLFGGAHLEIDLFCAPLGIAIEVDGYHHFRAEEAYRRDRRKDVLLQQLGIVVVRVLAEDVAQRLDDVVATIRMVVDRKKRCEGT